MCQVPSYTSEEADPQRSSLQKNLRRHEETQSNCASKGKGVAYYRYGSYYNSSPTMEMIHKWSSPEVQLLPEIICTLLKRSASLYSWSLSSQLPFVHGQELRFGVRWLRYCLPFGFALEQLHEHSIVSSWDC
jgi:hypothetical protein